MSRLKVKSEVDNKSCSKPFFRPQKLGDFGISKVLSANDNQTATLVGTPYYLSPEICMGKPYGAPSDCCEMKQDHNPQ